jgi:hypothetical protein
MEAEMMYRRMTGLVLALALAAGTIPAASAGGRMGIALLPPMPVTSPPSGYIPQPAQPVPSFPQPMGAPVVPMQPLPPQVTYFTPPQAVPVIK